MSDDDDDINNPLWICLIKKNYVCSVERRRRRKQKIENFVCFNSFNCTFDDRGVSMGIFLFKELYEKGRSLYREISFSQTPKEDVNLFFPRLSKHRSN